MTDVLVPFHVDEPKSRLAPLLSPAERVSFARAMLEDVLAAVRSAGGTPELLATAPLDVDTPVTVDERALSVAVNARLAASPPTPDEPLAVVMADLALATPDALRRLFDADEGVVLVPGRGGGTNAIVTRHPEFRVDYHGASYRDHLQVCSALDVTPGHVDSFRLSTDIDEPTDLVEVLLHGEGHAVEWLRDRGFGVAVGDGRVGVERR